MVLCRIRMKRLRAKQQKLNDLDASIILKDFTKNLFAVGGKAKRDCTRLAGNQKRVFLKLEELRTNGYQLGHYTYHEAISLFAHYGADKPVESCLDRMEATRIEPYHRSWIPIIHSAQKHKLEDIWKRIPDSVKSSSYSQKLWGTYSVRTKKNLISEMAEYGVKPSCVTYSRLMQISTPAEAAKAFSMIKKPTPYDKFLLQKSVAKTGDFEKVFSEGAIEGYSVSKWYVVCLLSIKLNNKPPSWDKVERVLEHYRLQKDAHFDVNVYSLLLDICLQNASHSPTEGDRWGPIGENIIHGATTSNITSFDHYKTLEAIYKVCGMAEKETQIRDFFHKGIKKQGLTFMTRNSIVDN